MSEQLPNLARHANPAQRFSSDEYWKFESLFCAPPALSGRVGALMRSAGASPCVMNMAASSVLSVSSVVKTAFSLRHGFHGSAPEAVGSSAIGTPNQPGGSTEPGDGAWGESRGSWTPGR